MSRVVGEGPMFFRGSTGRSRQLHILLQSELVEVLYETADYRDLPGQFQLCRLISLIEEETYCVVS